MLRYFRLASSTLICAYACVRSSLKNTLDPASVEYRSCAVGRGYCHKFTTNSDRPVRLRHDNYWASPITLFDFDDNTVFLKLVKLCFHSFSKSIYPHKMIQTTLSEVNFAERQSALQQKKKTRKQILPFVTTYHPSVRNLKNILMQNWKFIQNQPLLRTIFKNPPIISYKRGQSLKDMLVRAKI